MNTEERLGIAYNLLPPPLAATPAKYWTSISLWLHSYSVATTFQLLIREYQKVREGDLDEEQAFIIGFLHDMAQKMSLLGESSLTSVTSWVKERLESLKNQGLIYDEPEFYISFLKTNVAETMRDPALPDYAKRLLWISDRLQGVSNPLDIVQILTESRKDIGVNLDVVLFNITLPQPHLRSLLSRILYEKIKQISKDQSYLVIPISTPMGLVVITNDPKTLKEKAAAISWDKVRGGLDGYGLIDSQTEDRLFRYAEKCDRIKSSKSKSRSSKSSFNDDSSSDEGEKRGFVKENCDQGVYPDFEGNSYKIALIYYGKKSKEQGKVKERVLLPSHVKSMLQGLKLESVEYVEANGGGEEQYVCPLCGYPTPVGVRSDFIKELNKKLKMEQWNRYLYPGNVNIIMRLPSSSKYAVDPLCLGDVIARSWLNEDYIIAFTVRPPVPVEVLIDVGVLMYRIVRDQLKGGVPKGKDVQKLFYNDNWESNLIEITEGLSTMEEPRYVYDVFSSTVYIPYRDEMGEHAMEWVGDITRAGVLAGWGIYPLTISEEPPQVPAESLLTYYKGKNPLYDYSPSNKALGKYTPYVATTMASLAELYNRKYTLHENLPAVLEVLDFPPNLSPLLLQYSSPPMYSTVESLRGKLGGGAL